MPPDISTVSLATAIGLLAVGALAIAFAGTKLARLADVLADRTGMGEIMAGAVFVGGSTSLPGAITSMATAAQGHPGLAVGNAIGGLTVQTAFLAVADLMYRRVNLEHAGASVAGLTQGTLLVSLLTIPLIASFGPDVTVFSVHPASPTLILCYVLGLRLLATVRARPMWSPLVTDETQKEEVEGGAGQARPSNPPRAKPEERYSTSRLWVRFAAYALVTAVAGYLVGEAGISLVREARLSESMVGTVFTALSNSLPELVTAIAAVRAGALNLAIGDIIGGNSFEVLFLAAADVFYREGSLYHQFSTDNVLIALVAILMTGVLLLGMLRRERYGFAKIGFESATVLALYAGSVALLFV